MTLLLGPPSSGKTTLLQALAGKLDDTLQVCVYHIVLVNIPGSIYLTWKRQTDVGDDNLLRS